MNAITITSYEQRHVMNNEDNVAAYVSTDTSVFPHWALEIHLT